MSNLVCVIEDNLPIRRLFTTVLKKAGFDTVDFSDGASALAHLQSNPVNAIIMDILLPDINGTELIKSVREIESCKNIPIVSVTGFAQASDREKFLQAGFDGYIAKPINTQSFVSELQEIINKANK